MPKQRPHYKERIAHAEGYEIQYKHKLSHHGWEDCPIPFWDENCEYRVKPEPKPDVVQEVRAFIALNGILAFEGIDNNLRLTFDGETGQLKSAEVIKEEKKGA